MKTVRGLFFDLDGTLVDTMEANIHAYQKAIEHTGRKASRKQLVDSFGMRYDSFLRDFFPDISQSEIEVIKEKKGTYYLEFLHLSKPHRKLIDFIRTLRAEHTTILVTMAQRKNADAVIHASGIADLFDYLVTGEDVLHPKPHPEPFLKALELSKLKADEVLAFEDSESGIKSAKSAGIMTIKISIPEIIHS